MARHMSDLKYRELKYKKLAERYRWLLSELHGGNEFSKDQLWQWLQEADYIWRTY